MASVEQVLKTLKSWGSAENVAGMARFGIRTDRAFGVSVEPLKKYAKELGRDHAFAMELWKSGYREARVMAALIAEPKLLTAAQMNGWAKDFDSWEICDNACIHLFRKSPLAWERAFTWAPDKREFVRRAGFAMFATLAVHDKKAADEQFLEVLPLIEALSGDERNFVKKAVNWALRQIGKRNAELRKAAIEMSRKLGNRSRRVRGGSGKMR